MNVFGHAVRLHTAAATLSVAMLVSVGCKKESKVHPLPGTRMRMDVSAGAGFFDAPFPILYRMRPDRTLSVSGFPNPRGNDLLARLLAAMERSPTGFGTTSAVFLPFDGPLDPQTLPDEETSFTPASPVFLVDIDPASPELDRRVPVWVEFKAEAETYSPANLLAILPRPGMVLRADTLHAAVVTDGVADLEGNPLGSPLVLEQLKANRAPAGPHGSTLSEGFQHLWAHLERTGIPRDAVRAATVFRTGDPCREMDLLRDYIHTLPEPAASGLAILDDFPTYCVVRGDVTVPIFQAGERPYDNEGGEIRVNGQGLPETHVDEQIRFALTIPKGTMPPEGWPLLFYSAGQGGAYTQVVHRGTFDEQQNTPGRGPALYLADAGIAALSIEAPLVGPRSPTGDTSGMEFFNVTNPVALRDNFRQTAIDFSTLVRMARTLAVPAGLCPEADGGGNDFTFDSSRFFFYGHSTGATAGSVVLGLEPDFSAGLLSGVGGSWLYNLTMKFEPLDFATLTALMLEYDTNDAADIFDPVINLFNTFAESAEPMNWARRWAARPAVNARPKHVLIIEGVVDGYFPPPMVNALALSAGVEPVEPTVEPSLAEALQLTSGEVHPPPASANLPSPEGDVSMLLIQYPAPAGVSGHYVPFELAEPKFQYRCFFESFVRTGTATVFPADPDPLSPCPQ